jgi:hypothetical protein
VALWRRHRIDDEGKLAWSVTFRELKAREESTYLTRT